MTIADLDEAQALWNRANRDRPNYKDTDSLVRPVEVVDYVMIEMKELREG